MLGEGRGEQPSRCMPSMQRVDWSGWCLAHEAGNDPFAQPGMGWVAVQAFGQSSSLSKPGMASQAP
ncbi:MAG TPA: hypothetical protein DCP19_05705 [Pseudomonas sp.]|uniref:Uncharacterized protein n=1 Tax=Pseudomonas oryzihabitans TaxID=47885 RepID=A0A0U4XWZ9_9PSED|nr:hypothetical protein APT59_18825 [Pseudomonas oryzihabitans]HAC67424.1 hypothetical protein [Pseudomonas sp.]